MKRQLNWEGPFALCSGDAPVLFDDQAGQLNGLYLWGVTIDDAFLVNYVGETGRDFRERHIEHVQWWLSGYYRAYDAETFKGGELQEACKGIGDPRERGRMSEVILGHADSAPKIAAFLKVVRVMVAPFEAERRLRRRAEGAIYRKIRNSDSEQVRTFLETGNRYWHRHDNEEAIVFEVVSPKTIRGLGNDFTA